MPEYRIYYLQTTHEWCCMTEQDGGKVFGYGDTPQKALEEVFNSQKLLNQMLMGGTGDESNIPADTGKDGV